MIQIDTLLQRYKKSFLLNEGDVGMANYEKQVEQEAAYPIPILLTLYIRSSYASLLMPHCPVTVVKDIGMGYAASCSTCFS